MWLINDIPIYDNVFYVITAGSTSSTTCDRTSPFGSLKRSESNKSRSDYETQSEKYSPVMKSRSLDVSNMVISTTMAAINAPPTSTIINKPPFGSPNNRNSLHEDTVSNASSNQINPNVSPAWSRRFYNPTINNNNSNNKNNNNNNSTSRSGSSSSNSSSSSNVSLSSMSADLINDLCKTGSKNVKNLRNAYSLKSTNHGINSNKSVELAYGLDKRNLLNDSDSESRFVNMTIARFADQFSKDFMQRLKKRCKSDGMLYESDILATVNKRLSSSSPTSHYSEKALNNRPAITWNNRLTNNKHVPQTKGKRNVKNRGSLCRTVENLKLNFESKETESSNIGIAKEAKRGKSLPSSPVATNTMTMLTNPEPPSTPKLNYDKLGCEENNVKGLVDKYEVTKFRNDTNTAFNASTPNVISRFKRHTIHQSSPSHNTIHTKPPPIPHTSIVVASKPPNIILSKSLQQNNQSFARLKEHFNSASAYNTM